SDPSRVILSNGQDLHLDTDAYLSDWSRSERSYPPGLRFELVRKWPVGEPLQIAFSAETGTVLLHPASGLYLAIQSGLETHPLDLALQEILSQSSSADMVGAYQDFQKHWDREIQRLYNHWINKRPQDADVIREARTTWRAFQSAQRAMIMRTHDQEGSMHTIAAIRNSYQLSRNHARQMAEWGAL
ncbi:hypothetical protein RZS08_09685, partial [Arthrospira platensis SPKY1]|nr:hypothetical protein [Arthrospira platensis SPKY1]